MNIEENKKFCCKCGAELDANATFCPKCGEACNIPNSTEPTPIQQYNMNLKTNNGIKAKIDIKKTILNNIIPVACLAIGIILLIAGLGVSIPSDYISSYSMTEYVGGDAYNFIIEAGLRGGRIAGAMITKCVYIAIGLLISCVAALKINVVKPDSTND